MRPEAIMFVGAYGVLICWGLYMLTRALSTDSSSGKGFMEGERRAGYTGKIPSQ